MRERHTGLSDGWGAAFDGTSVVVTDSSTTMRWLDPVTLETTRAAVVRDGGRDIPWLNELEVVDGEVRAPSWCYEFPPCASSRLLLHDGIAFNGMSKHARNSGLGACAGQGEGGRLPPAHVAAPCKALRPSARVGAAVLHGA